VVEIRQAVEGVSWTAAIGWWVHQTDYDTYKIIASAFLFKLRTAECSVVCEGAGACFLFWQGAIPLRAAPEYNSEIYEKLERIFAHFHKQYISTYIYFFLCLDFNRNNQNTVI
jgi:hypothetical protein